MNKEIQSVVLSEVKQYKYTKTIGLKGWYLITNKNLLLCTSH